MSASTVSTDIVPIISTTGLEVSTTLTVATFYYPLQRGNAGADALPLEMVQVWWDTAFAGTITIESTARSTADVTNHAASAGSGWVTQNPTSAYIALFVATNTTVTSATVVVAAGTASGALFDTSASGARRTRVKIVCATGGVVGVAASGKGAR